MMGRECPDLPCDVALDDDEWRAVYATVKKEPPPAQPPSMKTMVGLIASLGGWLGRPCDGEPGPKAMWVGMQRMTDLALGWRARADHSKECDGRPSRFSSGVGGRRTRSAPPRTKVRAVSCTAAKRQVIPKQGRESLRRWSGLAGIPRRVIA